VGEWSPDGVRLVNLGTAHVAQPTTMPTCVRNAP
jgi:hypothetical protein